MLSFSSVLPMWVAIPLALLPAALNWWWTSRLPTDDATALPERHMALAQRVSAVTTSCAIVIGVAARWNAIWIVPLELLALTCTNHRTRRLLLGETWPLHRYLFWRVRMFSGVWAYWILVALAPAVVANATSSLRWWVAGLVFIVAIAWQRWYTRVLLFALGATRLTRPDLDGRFDEIFRRSRVPPPDVWRTGAAGGVLMNALALPALRGNGVLFFDTLLERLSPEEITAILAHEVAHLEYYDRRRLMRLYAGGILLVFALLVAGGWASEIAPELPTWMPALSIVVVFGSFWSRAQRMRPRETDADLRAVDLCEDPEALVSALTRTYTINHVPRRWSAKTEERATHPSLARRIAAIRNHANAPHPPGPVERLVVPSKEAGRWAVIDRDCVRFIWYDGDAVQLADVERGLERAHRSEMRAHTELSELRIAATARGLALRAVDHRGHRWSLPLHDRDAARVQSALDLVDHLIVAPPSIARVRIGERLVALIGLMIATVFGTFAAVAAPALVALRRPTRRAMIALAAALTATAAAIATDGAASYTYMIGLAALAAVALWEARGLREEKPAPENEVWRWVETAAFTAPVVIGLAVIGATTRDLYDLHTTIRDRAWLPAATMTLGVFLWLQPDRLVRRLGRLIAALAAVVMPIGSAWFLSTVVRDPLAAAMPAMTDQQVQLTTIARQAVDGEFPSVAIAPGGDAFLLAADQDEEDEAVPPPVPRHYVVGGFTGWSRSFQASDAVLVDDHSLLTLEREPERDAHRLRAEDIRTGRVVWTLPNALHDVSLIQAAADGRWRALARRGPRFTRIEGRIGSTATQGANWKIPTDGDGYVDARVGDGAIALGIVTRWQRPSMTWLSSSWRYHTTLLRAGPDGSASVALSRLSVDCLVAPIGVEGFVCTSFDGRWSWFWRFDPESGRLLPAGEARRGFWGIRQQTSTLLVGRRAGLAVLVSLDSHTVHTLSPAPDECEIDDFAIAKDLVAVSCAEGGRTYVTLYRIGRNEGSS